MIAIILLVTHSAAAPPPKESSPSQQAWTILADGVADKSVARRAKAIHALGLVKERRAQAMAEEALNDPDKDVRSEAATSLGRMHALTARVKLHACLSDKEVLVVLACTNSLYLLKDPIAYDVYYALLTEERKSSEGLVQSQLDTLRDRKQLEKLAFEAGIGFVPYGGIAWQTIKTVAHDDASPVRALAAERLAGDPDPRSAQALTDYLNDRKTKVREAVIEAIATRGDPKLLNPAMALLDDDNDSVRYDAAAAVICLARRHAVRTSQHPAGRPQDATVPKGAGA
jgi:HEAT repeat protein